MNGWLLGQIAPRRSPIHLVTTGSTPVSTYFWGDRTEDEGDGFHVLGCSRKLGSLVSRLFHLLVHGVYLGYKL